MNLFLALLWLIGAIVVFAYQYFTGDDSLQIRRMGVSLGWLMLALSLYNWVRWWGIRAYRADQRAIQIAQARRHGGEHWRERRQPGGELDPNFDFSDTPPQANRNLGDQPPSAN
jgi:hypothetical protein